MFLTEIPNSRPISYSYLRLIKQINENMKDQSAVVDDSYFAIQQHKTQYPLCLKARSD